LFAYKIFLTSLRQWKALHRKQENKGNPGCDEWTTWKNGPECRLKTYRRRRETEESGVDLSMKRPTFGSRMVEDKANKTTGTNTCRGLNPESALNAPMLILNSGGNINTCIDLPRWNLVIRILRLSCLWFRIAVTCGAANVRLLCDPLA